MLKYNKKEEKSVEDTHTQASTQQQPLIHVHLGAKVCVNKVEKSVKDNKKKKKQKKGRIKKEEKSEKVLRQNLKKSQKKNFHFCKKKK